MRVATALLCAATAVTAAVVPASAGHAAACRGGLTDPRGDAPSPDLDIVGVDAAAGRAEVVILLRLASRDAATGVGLLPASWTVAFTSRGVAYTAVLRRGPQGESASLTAGGAPVPFRFRRDSAGLTWWARRRDVPRLTSICQVSATTTLATLTADAAS
jgi:hypothetical protein